MIEQQATEARTAKSPGSGASADLIVDVTAADIGLLYGMQIPKTGPLREIELTDIDAALAGSDSVIWLHFNLSNARARSLLTHARFVPPDLQEVFRDNEVRRRVEHAIELLAWILGQRTASLTQLTQDMSEQVSEIEGEILGGAIKEQRVQLGRIRRFCARTRRQ